MDHQESQACGSWLESAFIPQQYIVPKEYLFPDFLVCILQFKKFKWKDENSWLANAYLLIASILHTHTLYPSDFIDFYLNGLSKINSPML